MYFISPHYVNPKAVLTKCRPYLLIINISNIIQLLSKIVLGNIKSVLVKSRIISKNQGTLGGNTIDAKKLILLNKVIQDQYKGRLASAWLDAQ